MTQQSTFRLQHAFRKFAHINGWKAPFAVTLTMKQGLLAEGPNGKSFINLTPERASQNLSHFLNLLNKRVYGNAYTRYGTRLNVIPILEGGSGKRLHYHLMIDCPRDDLKDLFPQIILSLWDRTQWSLDQSYIHAGADSGWISYISKTRDKPSFEDSIDWLNYYNLD